MSVINRQKSNLTEIRINAVSTAKNLKMKDAALNILVLPVVAPGYLLGILFYGLKIIWGLLKESFKAGARMSTKS